jgi:molybdopterin-guanine dinucleotide biosynthesis protein A
VTAAIDATLVILAGGRSSRMGRPKAELPVAGTTLVAWLVARLGPSFIETIVVGAPAAPGSRAIPDRRPDAGPVAGIEAALSAAPSDRVFVLACDTPRATANLAQLLVDRCSGHDAAVARLAGRPQPTVAAYARSAGPKLSAYLDADKRRATEALGVLDVEYIDDAALARSGIAPAEFADLDTPADYEAFVAEVRT